MDRDENAALNILATFLALDAGAPPAPARDKAVRHVEDDADDARRNGEPLLRQSSRAAEEHWRRPAHAPGARQGALPAP